MTKTYPANRLCPEYNRTNLKRNLIAAMNDAISDGNVDDLVEMVSGNKTAITLLYPNVAYSELTTLLACALHHSYQLRQLNGE